jgi:hypothetical protein
MAGRGGRRPRERKVRSAVPPSVERYILAQRPGTGRSFAC